MCKLTILKNTQSCRMYSRTSFKYFYIKVQCKMKILSEWMYKIIHVVVIIKNYICWVLCFLYSLHCIPQFTFTRSHYGRGWHMYTVISVTANLIPTDTDFTASHWASFTGVPKNCPSWSNLQNNYKTTAIYLRSWINTKKWID